MNQPKNSKTFDYEEAQRRIAQAHQRATGDALGDVNINLLLKHNTWLLSDCFNDALKAYSLNCISYFVLISLYTSPDNQANPCDICVCTGETRANMTRICDELVEQKLILRIPSATDRRRIDISLTPEGISVLETIIPQLRTHIETIFKVFDETEKATLERLLLKLMHSLTGS
ncbi:MAG: MarR family winged helix-turn-helix transcriptional regulator [Pseudomonadota bacterium]